METIKNIISQISKRMFRRAVVIFFSMLVLFLISQFNLEEKVSRVFGYDTSDSEIIPVSTELASREGPYAVLKVVDGDTIDVGINGEEERIRLLGINTPEVVDPRKAVECFGREASDKAKAVLSGKSVYLEGDQTQGDRDAYDRLLRYVYLEDGTLFNKLMILDGYAYEYTYNIPYKHQSDFKQAQKIAEEQRLGLWSEAANCQ